jgi:hypothetical protein
MAVYALIDQQSSKVENVIEYDPEGTYLVPEGKRVEPFDPEKHVWPPAEG